MVIPGWDKGIMGLQVGGKRTLRIPSRLGYGEQGAGLDIPPNSDLEFDCELVGIGSGPLAEFVATASMFGLGPNPRTVLILFLVFVIAKPELFTPYLGGILNPGGTSTP
mmetsp:Transcript_116030/g.205123  ORF Transcript_116030/g.205123 Transcript_116030/m.205123 type:complete len:109 (-) Transcript_116030:96-422(-)